DLTTLMVNYFLKTTVRKCLDEFSSSPVPEDLEECVPAPPPAVADVSDASVIGAPANRNGNLPDARSVPDWPRSRARPKGNSPGIFVSSHTFLWGHESLSCAGLSASNDSSA